MAALAHKSPPAGEGLRGAWSRLLGPLRRRAADLLFERRGWLDTAEEVPASLLYPGDPYRVGYEPTGWRTLKRLLPAREVGEEDVFLDLGSGKGRVVYQAALYPFRQVIGVEQARELHEIAQANIARNRSRLRCRDVRLVHGDACEYEIPDDVTVLFLHNPFRGPLFARVVANIERSLDRRPRLLRIVYVTPREEAALLATGRARLVRAAGAGRLYEMR